METYVPFLVNHWRTVGLISVSIAAGVALGQLNQTKGRTVNRNQQVHSNIVVKPVKSESANEQVDEVKDDDQQFPEDQEVLPIVFKYEKPSEVDSIRRSEEFYLRMNQRRSVREISSDPVALEVIENIIKTGGKLFSSI